MVNRFIAEYMANSRRLILPGVGAFVRRTEGGEIVFVEMFKQNDGVLTNLISQKMDISAEQANILIERLITELQHDLRYYGYYTIPALGTLRQTEKSIIFQADAPASLQAEQPQAVQSKEVTPPAPRYEKVEEQEIVATPKEEKPAPTVEKKPEPKVEVAAAPKAEPQPAPKVEEPVRPAEKESTTTDNVKFKLFTSEKEIAKSAEQSVAKEPKKVAKPTPATQERFRFEAHKDSEESAPQRISIRTNRKRKKMDGVTLMAIIAAAIAVIVIIYGLVSSPGPVFDEPLLPAMPDTTAVELVAPESAN
ncbi:MAG: hypothetical protein IIX17_03975 [Tidjanibacter sp.]|nr:hypothetical protein [Tidjanibacter sp.]